MIDSINTRMMQMQTMNYGKEVPSAARVQGIKEDDKLREVSRQFEAIFIKQLLDQMRKTVDKSDLMGETSMGRDVFEDMLYGEYSKIMSKTGSFGISELLYSQLSRFPASEKTS